VYLKISPEMSWQRIKNDPNRPLADLGRPAVLEILNTRGQLFESIQNALTSDEFLKIINCVSR